MRTDEERPIDVSERIVVDPGILVGKPVINGTRILVSLILNLVAHRASFAEIVEDYPILTVEDIRSAILCAGTRLDRGEVVSLSPR